MLQTLHIFSKDVRSLRYEIGVTLAVAATFVFFQVTDSRFRDLGTPLLLVIAGWLLTVRVVHEEPLPGTRQFWLTRPYSRASLLAAKILFLLAFIVLPKTIADLAITLHAGFSFSDLLPGLLCSQVLLFTLFAIPIAAIAAVTTNLAQAIVASLPLMFMLAISGGSALGPLDWVRHAAMALALAAAALSVVVFAYGTRRTTLARLLAGVLWIAAVVIGVGLNGSLGSAVESRVLPVHLDDVSRVGMDFGFTGTATLMSGFNAQIRLPIRFAGLPVEKATSVEMLPRIIATNLRIRASDGTLWPPENGFLTGTGTNDSEPALDFNVPANYYAKLKAGPASLRATLYVTLYGNRKTFSIDSRRVIIPGVGACSFQPMSQNVTRPAIICLNLFRSPRLLLLNNQELSGQQPSFFYQLSHSPFPAELGIQPSEMTVAMGLQPSAQLPLEIITLEPLAHFQRQVSFTNLKLDQLKEEVFPMSR